MELKKKILMALGIEDKEIALEYQAKLTDGTIVVSDADELAAGISISVLAEDGTTMPLPVGEYETEEGVSFSVEEEGVVAEIYESETEEEVELDKDGLINEIGAVIKELLQEVKTDIERLDAELNEMKGEKEELKENLGNLETEKAELTAEVEKLSKEPATEPVKTSKFNEVKSEKLSKAEYRELTRKEKYWYNIKNN